MLGLLCKNYSPPEFESGNFQGNHCVLGSLWCGRMGDGVMRLIVGAFCGVALLSGSAWAATLEPTEGALAVNQGGGFRPVKTRIDANVGDSVMVAPGGSATLVYDDGCKVEVQPGSVTTIAALSPCAAGSFAQDNNTNNAMTIGTLAVVGGVAGTLIYEGTKSTNNSSSPPASP
jgi:hypothetical protein